MRIFNTFSFGVVSTLFTMASRTIANGGNGVHPTNIPNSEFNRNGHVIIIDNSIPSTDTPFGRSHEGMTKYATSIDALGEGEEKSKQENNRQALLEPIFNTHATNTDITYTRDPAFSVDESIILTTTTAQKNITAMSLVDQNNNVMMLGGREEVDFFVGDYYYSFTPLSEEETRERVETLQHTVQDKPRQQNQQRERLEDALLEMMDKDDMGRLLQSIPNEEHHEQQNKLHQWRVQRIPKDSLISYKNVDISIYSSTLSSPQILSKGGRRLEIDMDTTDQSNINYDIINQPQQQTQQPNAEAQDENENSNLVFILTNSLLSLACVIFAALAAGLTMGLLSLDPLSLEIKRRASVYSTERKQSAELLPLLVGHGRKHRLLVSLLILNSLANEALPLFLDELLPGKYASILVSVTLVLFFGEIVPSACEFL